MQSRRRRVHCWRSMATRVTLFFILIDSVIYHRHLTQRFIWVEGSALSRSCWVAELTENRWKNSCMFILSIFNLLHVSHCVGMNLEHFSQHSQQQKHRHCPSYRGDFCLLGSLGCWAIASSKQIEKSGGKSFFLLSFCHFLCMPMLLYISYDGIWTDTLKLYSLLLLFLHYNFPICNFLPIKFALSFENTHHEILEWLSSGGMCSLFFRVDENAWNLFGTFRARSQYVCGRDEMVGD